MGVIGRAVSRVARMVRSTVLWSSGKAAYVFGYRPTLSGVEVTDSSALESTAYFAGIRNVSEDLATVPCIVYRRVGEDGRERDPDHYLYPIVHDQPNEETDAVQFFEMMQAWAMMRRNAYAEIVRDSGGRAAALWPIPPYRVTPRRFEGELFYDIYLPDGEKDPKTGLPWSTLDRSRILHVKAMALDGVLGLSSTESHKEAIGTALALDRYGAGFFGQDATPGGIYQVPGRLSDEAYKRMKAELLAPHTGLDRKHRSALLEEGTTWTATSVPNDKAQFLDSKRFQTEEMARINRIAPHKIGDLSRATFSNIEHQGIDYVVSTMRPVAVRWEKAIGTQVMLRDDRATHFVEFLLEALLRGDAKAQADALAIMRQNGIINADEWRRLKNMNPIGGETGQAYLVNGNMLPVAQAGKPQGKPSGDVVGVDPVRVFRPLFQAASVTCLRRESVAVARAAEKLRAPGGAAAFEAWASSFYEEQRTAIVRAWTPLGVAVGEAIRGETGPDLGDWAEGWARALAHERVRAATEDLRKMVASREAHEVVRSAAERWASEEQVSRAASREGTALVESARKYIASLTEAA